MRILGRAGARAAKDKSGKPKKGQQTPEGDEIIVNMKSCRVKL